MVEDDVVGVEAALWSETLETRADVEEMAFPRLLATAELAWSHDAPDWDEFRPRAAEESADTPRGARAALRPGRVR